MDLTGVLAIAFRWLHVVAAALVIGGAVFLRFIVPAALAALDADARGAVFLRCRRGFKFIVHGCVLFLLLSGTYNAYKNWGVYSLNRPVMHGLFGTHLLLGLIIMGISLWVLAGREPPKSHRTWSRVNIVLLLLTVAVASTLKYARDRRTSSPPPVQVSPPGEVR